MLFSLQRAVGLPVVWHDQQMGYVERAIPNLESKKLGGIVSRRGLGSAKWVESTNVDWIGSHCVLIDQKPQPMPTVPIVRHWDVYLTSGQHIGHVSDTYLLCGTLTLYALEVSAGPFYQLAGKTVYATDFHASLQEDPTNGVTVSDLLTWSELVKKCKEEERT